MLRKSSCQLNFLKASGDLFRRAAAAIGWQLRTIGMEPTVENASQAYENRGPIGGTIDDRGRAQPAELAVADMDRRNPDGRGFQNAAGRVADHGVGEPQRRPVALAAKRGEDVCPAG